MKPRWDYRSVEGALYGLGDLHARAAMSEAVRDLPPEAARVVQHGPVMTQREARTTIAFTRSLSASLDNDELKEVTTHYIFGVKRRDGREGYRKRERIIKKLVSSLNEDPLTDDERFG